ncbi:hypothetical protein SpCBS45565_g07128 [Spizellomyces sp. 'palustris']|nr:hypothetical protein SpCBS45565_g07128 [Spizellomyces sp. 'palustris']
MFRDKSRLAGIDSHTPSINDTECSKTVVSPLPRPMQKLNHDILYHFFAQFSTTSKYSSPFELDQRDLLRCAQVCRSWADVAIPQLWKSLHLVVVNGYGVSAGGLGSLIGKLEQDGAVRANYVRQLRVSVCYEGAAWGADWGDENVVWEQFIQRVSVLTEVLEKIKRVEKIDLCFKIRPGRLSDEQQITTHALLNLLLKILTKPPRMRLQLTLDTPTSLLLSSGLNKLGSQLEYLTIQGGWSSEEDLVELLEAVDPLKGLTMERCGMGEGVCSILEEKHAPTLKIFDLQSAPRHDEEARMIGQVIENCSSLNHFRWTRSSSCEGDMFYFNKLDPITQYPSNLTTLDIGGMSVDDGFWNRLVVTCPHLISIGCRSTTISDVGVRILVKTYSTNLKRLDLSCCQFLSHKVLPCIAHHARNVEVLEFRNTKDILMTPRIVASLAPLLENCLRLTTLTLGAALHYHDTKTIPHKNIRSLLFANAVLNRDKDSRNRDPWVLIKYEVVMNVRGLRDLYRTAITGDGRWDRFRGVVAYESLAKVVRKSKEVKAGPSSKRKVTRGVEISNLFCGSMAVSVGFR